MRTHLTRRRGKYYIRIRVPNDLVQALGRREIVRSLQTADRSTAVLRLSHIQYGIRYLLEDARTMIDHSGNGTRRSAPPDLESALDALQRQMNGATTRLEAFRPSRNGYEDPELDALITRRIDEVEGAVARARKTVSGGGVAGNSPSEDNQVAEVERQTALAAGLRDHLDKLYVTLQQLAQGGSAEDMARLAGPLMDDITTGSTRAHTAGPKLARSHTTSPNSPAADERTCLESAKETYRCKRKNMIKEKTLASHAAAIDDFIGVIGNKALPDVERADVVMYRNTLEARPSGRREGGVLDYDTVSKKLSHIKSFFAFLRDNHYCSDNPAADVQATKPSEACRPEDERPPFTSKQLQTFLDAPLFTGCKHPKRVHVPGEHLMNYDGRFWYPLLTLFAGLRMGEIEQLEFDDIVTHHNVLCFDICHEVKSRAGKRLVPIHPILKELGFLEWVDYRWEKAEGRRIFESYKYRRFFNEGLLTDLGLKEDGLVLYSLRHTFADRIDGVSDKAKDRLMGHSHGGESNRYGSAKITETQMRVVEQARFDDIDFSRIPKFRGAS